MNIDATLLTQFYIISSSAIAAHADAGSQKQAVAMCCYGKFLSRPQRAEQALSSVQRLALENAFSTEKVRLFHIAVY